MRPAFHHEMATARIAGLHHHAAREWTATAASHARRLHKHHRTCPVPGHTVTGLARRVIEGTIGTGRPAVVGVCAAVNLAVDYLSLRRTR